MDDHTFTILLMTQILLIVITVQGVVGGDNIMAGTLSD